MEAIEYRTVDKGAWMRGPWDDEPDKVQWQDEATGLPCLIVRGPSGALCGYVGVSPGHPWHNQTCDEVQARGGEYVDVHGGLTFAAGCRHGPDPSMGICHVPAPGEPDDVWWLGFDCAHLGDRWGMAWHAHLSMPGFRQEDAYRDVAYVRAECAKLARQAAEASA